MNYHKTWKTLQKEKRARIRKEKAIKIGKVIFWVIVVSLLIGFSGYSDKF